MSTFMIAEKEIRHEIVKPPNSFIEKQANLLDRLLNKIHVKDIIVTSHSVIRDVDELRRNDGEITFGYIGAFSHDASFTTFIATAPDKRVATYFITATEEHSGLLADDSTGTLYTDSFWRLDSGILEHVTPTEPILLDGISMCYDGLEDIDPILKSHYSETVQKVVHTAAHKIRAKEILESAGVSVPELPKKGEQIVFKYEAGGYGDDILMTDESSPTYEHDVKTFINNYPPGTVYNEKRIIPFPNSKMAQKLNEKDKSAKIKDDEVDWNTRTFLSLERDPQVLFTRTRYDKRSNKAVNVEQGALSTNAEELLDEDTINRSNAVAQQAVSALYNSLYVEGDQQNTALAVGVDVIQDADSAYVMEVQPFAGGIHALPIQSPASLPLIAEKIVDCQLPYLKERFEKRTKNAAKNLRRIPFMISAKDNIYLRRSELRNLQEEMGIAI